MPVRLWRSMDLKWSHSTLGGARATDASVMVLYTESTIRSNDTTPAVVPGRTLPASEAPQSSNPAVSFLVPRDESLLPVLIYSG
jgi:hypothetical protein